MMRSILPHTTEIAGELHEFRQDEEEIALAQLGTWPQTADCPALPSTLGTGPDMMLGAIGMEGLMLRRIH